MPYLEAALYSYLQTVPEVAALVDDRIYPIRLPQGAELPAVTQQRISAQRAYTHDPFAETLAWVNARVQFTCWSETQAEAIEVGEAIVLALSGYEGDLGGVPMGSATVVLELDGYEAATKLFRRIVDVRFDYEEATTTS